MKFIKIFLFTLVAFFSINLISTQNIVGFIEVEAATKPDITMAVSGPTLVVKDAARSYDFTTTSSGGFFSGLAPVMTNLIQTATGIADPNNPSGVVNITYTYNIGGTFRDNDPLIKEKNVTFSTVGTSYLRACVDKNAPTDANGVIDESEEKNNCSSWITITVIASPFIDLQVSSINKPTVFAGVSKYFDATIYNRGPGFTNYLGINSFQNKFQSADGFSSFPDGTVDYSKPVNLVEHTPTALSQVRVLSPEGTFIREYNVGVIIRWEDRAVVSQSITLNNVGTNNYIRVCADVDSVIVESDNDNNCGPWTQMTVSPAPVVYNINVTKVGTGSGVVSSVPNSYIDCGNDCSEDIANLPLDPTQIGGPTKKITLNPKASSGSFFAGWEYPSSYTTNDINNMEEIDETGKTSGINPSVLINHEYIAVFNLNRIPGVACSNVENVTQNTATITCSMVRNGSNVTTSGIVWSASTTFPTSSDNIGKTTDGSTGIRGAWTSSIVGLKPNTRYYVRGYSTNSLGTDYSGSWTFNTLSSGSPDLQVSVNITPTATIAGDTTFSATIKNFGTVTTGSSFTNLFQTATSIADINNPTGLQNYAVAGMATLAPDATAVTTKTLNLAVSTKYIRACADNNASMVGTIDEGTNEGNNCSEWISVTVGASSSPSGTLTVSPSSCKIAKDASTCTVTGAKWNTTNAVSPSLVDDNTGTTLSTLANNDVTPLKVWVAYPQTKFILKDGATPLEGATSIVTASCDTATEWDTVGKTCLTDLCLFDAGLQTVGPCINPGPTDSLDGISCEIKLGQKNCTTTLELNIVSPVLGADTNVTKNTPVFNTEVIKSNQIQSFPTFKSGIIVDYPSTTFFLNHNTLTVAEKQINATCEFGAEWSVNKCIKAVIGDVDGVWDDATFGQCTGCDPFGENGTQTVDRTCIGPTGNGKACVGQSSFTQSCSCPLPGGLITLFTASPEKIYKGRYTTLGWNSSADTCSIVDSKGMILDTKNNKKGNIKTFPTSDTSYTLTCSKGGVTETKQIDVKVINVVIIEG